MCFCTSRTHDDVFFVYRLVHRDLRPGAQKTRVFDPIFACYSRRKAVQQGACVHLSLGECQCAKLNVPFRSYFCNAMPTTTLAHIQYVRAYVYEYFVPLLESICCTQNMHMIIFPLQIYTFSMYNLVSAYIHTLATRASMNMSMHNVCIRIKRLAVHTCTHPCRRGGLGFMLPPHPCLRQPVRVFIPLRCLYSHRVWPLH